MSCFKLCNRTLFVYGRYYSIFLATQAAKFTAIFFFFTVKWIFSVLMLSVPTLVNTLVHFLLDLVTFSLDLWKDGA